MTGFLLLFSIRLTRITRGSQSGSLSESLSEDFRRKIQAAESIYEAKKKNERLKGTTTPNLHNSSLHFLGSQPKKKKAKKDVFTVYFNYDGIFTSFLLKYSQGHMKELNDTNFDEMSYEHLKEIALRLIPHACFEKIYYCQTGAKLSLGVRELKST
nr:hypothetical protein [Tanacetum cinerariifolium]